jgi:hypothetical protein
MNYDFLIISRWRIFFAIACETQALPPFVITKGCLWDTNLPLKAQKASGESNLDPLFKT